MKTLLKIGLATTFGLALALPAAAQNARQTNTAAPARQPIIATQGTMLIGTLGTTTTTTSVGAIVAIAAAEAVASTGHTK